MLTPSDLADELGISPKRIRDYLRAGFTRPGDEKYQRWHLTPEMAAAVRQHFR